MKKEAGRRTVIRVMAVLFGGIMAGTVAASGVSRGEETEMVLCYEDLENLVKESCPQVEMERRQLYFASISASIFCCPASTF
jgi:hypothetical protein